VLLVVGALVVIGPLAVFFARNPGPLFQRTREVYLFEPDVMTHSKAKYRVETDEEVVVEQLKRSLLTFNFYADSSTQFGYRYPMFVSALAVCVMLGVGYCLRHWRHPGAGLVAIWTLVTLLIGSALTVDAPFWPRLVGVLPAAALAAGLAIDRVWALLEGEARAARRAVSRLAAVAATGLLVSSGVDGWQRYLGSVEYFVRPQAQLGRYLSSLPREVVACNLGGPLELKVRETAFLAWPRPLVELMPGGRAALAECPGPPFVWVLDSRTEALLPRLREQWPGGAVVRHRNADGQLVFTTFEVR
jgi:hypothetical protein